RSVARRGEAMRREVGQGLRREASEVALGRHRREGTAGGLARAVEILVAPSFAETLEITIRQQIEREEVVGVVPDLFLEECDRRGRRGSGSSVRRRREWKAGENEDGR